MHEFAKADPSQVDKRQPRCGSRKEPPHSGGEHLTMGNAACPVAKRELRGVQNGASPLSRAARLVKERFLFLGCF